MFDFSADFSKSADFFCLCEGGEFIAAALKNFRCQLGAFLSVLRGNESGVQKSPLRAMPAVKAAVLSRDFGVIVFGEENHIVRGIRAAF